MGTIKRIILGDDGKLRPLWRALAFVGTGTYVVPLAIGPPLAWLADRLGIGNELSPASISIGECATLLTALGSTALFAWYEKRRVDDYGLPLRQAFRGRFWEGCALGAASAGLVALGMVALHGMTVDGLALHGIRILWAALAWLGANLLIGLGEELWYRSYLLQTLWKSLGFWPAAAAIALLFASDHYFYKQGENVWDVITLVSLSIWICYSVLRTGTLWLAVGFHVAFDYMQLFVIGTKNGNLVPVDHLLNASFQGPAWINGGVLGTEASLLMYPVIALLFVYIWRRKYKQPSHHETIQPSLLGLGAREANLAPPGSL